VAFRRDDVQLPRSHPRLALELFPWSTPQLPTTKTTMAGWSMSRGQNVRAEALPSPFVSFVPRALAPAAALTSVHQFICSDLINTPARAWISSTRFTLSQSSELEIGVPDTACAYSSFASLLGLYNIRFSPSLVFTHRPNTIRFPPCCPAIRDHHQGSTYKPHLWEGEILKKRASYQTPLGTHRPLGAACIRHSQCRVATATSLLICYY
jgi:hypothetical protein